MPAQRKNEKGTYKKGHMKHTKKAAPKGRPFVSGWSIDQRE